MDEEKKAAVKPVKEKKAREKQPKAPKEPREPRRRERVLDAAETLRARARGRRRERHLPEAARLSHERQ